MNSILNIRNGLYLLAALFIISCDEGKIYPDDTVDSGRTATVTLTFDGLGAWPKKNYLSLAAIGEDGSTVTLTKRINKPSKSDQKVTIRLNNLKENTKSIDLAVISNGQSLIYSYYSYPVDNSMENITLPIENLNLASFNRIQKQVFENSCIACHGGSTHVSGNLNLTDDKAYAALVNVEAPLSPENKKYVSPGDAEESYLIDILEENDYHKDMFNSTGKQEVLGLIKAWIDAGAANN